MLDDGCYPPCWCPNKGILEEKLCKKRQIEQHKNQRQKKILSIHTDLASHAGVNDLSRVPHDERVTSLKTSEWEVMY